MAQFASDTFTGTDGTALETYSASWAKPTGAIGSAVLINNRVRQSGTSNVWYYHTGSPASADYSANVDIYRNSGGDTSSAAGPNVRQSTTALTAYHARYNATGTPALQLYKAVSNTFTLLGSTTSFTQPTAGGAAKNLKVEASGTTINLYWDGAGTPDITTTDSAISAAGKAGLRWLGFSTPSDTVGLQLDNFSGDDPATGGNLTLTGEDGALTLTGQTATANIALVGSDGSLTLTGQDATLTLTGNLSIEGEAATLSLTGQVSSLSTAFVGSEGALTLTGQDSALNAVLNGSEGTLQLTGQDSSFSLSGPLILTGEEGSLVLTGYSSEFYLTGQTKGGAGKASNLKKKKKVRRTLEIDTSDLEVPVEVAPVLEVPVIKQEEVIKPPEPTPEEPVPEPDAVAILSMRVDLLVTKLEQADNKMRKLQSKLDKSTESFKKQVRELEDLIIVLNNT